MKKIYKLFSLCFVCIILLNILTVSSTVFLHEASHFFAGIYFKCESVKIILMDFPSMSTYTEARCKPETPIHYLSLAPILFVTIFGLSFLSMKKLPERHLSWLIIGFNLVIGFSDFRFVAINYLMIILGFGLIIYGQTKFINQLLQLLIGRR